MIIINDKNPSSSLFCLTNLQQLILTNTNLTLLPEIKNLGKLSTLKITSDNGAVGTQLPSEISQLKSLGTLALTNITNLESLPDGIEELTSLQVLTLAQIPNLVSIAPSHLGQLTNLMSLDLVDVPQVSKLPYPMENFQRLTRLTVTNTGVPSLELKNLQKLSTLSVVSNAVIESIALANLSLLNSLEITENNASQTLVMQNLPILQSLRISSNQRLNSIVAENLPALKSWSIYSSPTLEKVSLVNVTGISSATFTSLPILESLAFENAPNLISVTLTGSFLLKTLLFSNTPQVAQLDLSSCQLKSLPSSILGLKALQTLNLASNQLSSLPNTFSTDLPNLQVLTLDGNQFRGSMIQPPLIYVRELHMNNNSLTTLDGIGEYRSLQKISLDNNQITSFPPEIMKISPVLQYISIISNPLTSILYQMTNMRALKFLLAMENSISRNEKIYLMRLFQVVPFTINLSWGEHLFEQLCNTLISQRRRIIKHPSRIFRSLQIV